MSTTYKSNTAMVNFSVTRGASLGLRNMLTAVHNEAKPKTPKDLGDLKDNVLIQILGTAGTITWLQDYAIYQEKPSRKFNYTTPGTGGHFAENAVRKVVKDSGKYFDNAMKITAQPRSNR